MRDVVDLWTIPQAEELYMIAGWHQWADAGAISSGLPQYLIQYTGASKIGEIKPKGFYLFQIPGTHHLLRPEIKLDQGYRQTLQTHSNELFYIGNDQKGLVIFLGDEPHLAVDEYAEAFFDIVEELDVKRVAALGGVYGPVPYDKDREIACVYSLPYLKEELSEYAVRFSDYEGGVTIGSYLLDQAEERGLEYFAFYGFVPAYDLSQNQSVPLQGLRVENDYKAWYDIMRRLSHMFGLEYSLSDLDESSDELINSMSAKIDELEQKLPQLKVREYIEKVSDDFTETSFMPLSDVWKRELDDLFEDLE
ncbi:MAG: PAC2 family protein [Anaerolineaceae bacterium]|nr:PAC2 family protein [Anaerolineaceae bacterium]MCB9099379.1 PAC2 family protein [Anaerolineales bacterium]